MRKRRQPLRASTSGGLWGARREGSAWGPETSMWRAEGACALRRFPPLITVSHRSWAIQNHSPLQSRGSETPRQGTQTEHTELVRVLTRVGWSEEVTHSSWGQRQAKQLHCQQWERRKPVLNADLFLVFPSLYIKGIPSLWCNTAEVPEGRMGSPKVPSPASGEPFCKALSSVSGESVCRVLSSAPQEQPSRQWNIFLLQSPADEAVSPASQGKS